MFELFGCHREVVEVMISPRRNRLGRCFRFARFRGAEDIRMLAVRLDNIMVYGKKIHLNQPSFARNILGEYLRKKSEGKKTECSNLNGIYGKSGSLRGNKSYVDMVARGSNRGGVPKETPTIIYSSTMKDRARWGKAFIGEVFFPREYYRGDGGKCYS